MLSRGIFSNRVATLRGALVAKLKLSATSRWGSALATVSHKLGITVPSPQLLAHGSQLLSFPNILNELIDYISHTLRAISANQASQRGHVSRLIVQNCKTGESY